MISGYWVVVPAAGAGRRMGADQPKQYLPLLGRPILSLTLRNILTWPGLAGVVVAISADDRDFEHLPEARDSRVHPVQGGAERADSVLAALNFLAPKVSPATQVLVHDAARPCVAVEDIEALLAAESASALLARPASDTVKLGQKSAAGISSIEKTLDRSRIWLAQTPQRAPLSRLHSALREALERGDPVTDEASALEFAGDHPQLVLGRSDNLKLTHPEDIPLAEAVLRLRFAAVEGNR
ncbi:2-C-methyl-D-erythritol 4-phosphate cytidylyltransferase [Microbulbifer flavimaris]|uniref:2-C-methyl-D-erythritol 4-phosphate cytidylyltransferase n=1 Tax=Microbulbifer flavimaris TaxID=1781068 RepID=A0ABX4HX36_9GAMM|nr:MULTISPECIES: 2-C-methyl-D-erythritol 4-phosphate cytidylyltransferase [Microbulbifer]KUJ81644.1 2-C-methyl-D-erythritol 4-phosphate cytidylyltransferase [Microbulbifer sp. ZGT114]PCO04558.1 2-C-methyl-D-erythritol 4-phosphate cytidylyltransferase [Microbulbifer flavimaris]